MHVPSYNCQLQHFECNIVAQQTNKGGHHFHTISSILSAFVWKDSRGCKQYLSNNSLIVERSLGAEALRRNCFTIGLAKNLLSLFTKMNKMAVAAVCTIISQNINELVKDFIWRCLKTIKLVNLNDS